MIESGITALLLADATVSSALGTNLYPLILPETPTYPALTYRNISAIPQYDLNGNVISAKTRIEFTAWGLNYGDCKNVQSAIKDVLDTYSGTLPNGVNVSFSWRDGSTVDGYDSVRRAYYTSVDYRFTHTE